METFKKYFLSTAISFGALFFLSLGTQLQDGGLTAETLNTSVVFGIIGAAARTAFKGITEGIILPAGRAAGRVAGRMARAAFKAPDFPLEK